MTSKLHRMGRTLKVLGGCILPVAVCFILPAVPVVSAGPVPTMVAAQVDLDYVYDQDVVQQEHNLELLVKRVCDLGITTVVLQAFADPDGDDAAAALYFPSRFLPLRCDLFATAVRALKQCNVQVYAWIPLLAFIPPEGQEELAVLETLPGRTACCGKNTYRLSPFNPVARKIITGIYEDLAQTPMLDGILFHDDGRLSDFEDGSTEALAAYSRAGFPKSIACMRQNAETLRRWSRFKTKVLIDLSQTLLDIIRKKHPDIRSARNLYALPVVQPESEQWFAQSLAMFLQAYDYTFLMAMPYMEEAGNPVRWLQSLADTALKETVNPASLVFELQTRNWQKKAEIPTAEIIEQLRVLQQAGGLSFAWYPDDFFQNHPEVNAVRHTLSTIR